MNRYLVFTAALAALFAGCDSYEQDAFAPEYVVEAYLVAGAPLPELKLSQTARLAAVYTFEQHAVEGAAVTVALLGAGGEVERRYAYTAVREGVYAPAEASSADLAADLLVQPLRWYALEIDVPGAAEPLRARTFVPGFLEVLGTTADTLVYQSGEQFDVHVRSSAYPGRQGIYVAKLVARDTSYGMSPFYADLVEEGEEDPDELVENRSGVVNEAFFTGHPDGTMTLRLPWVAVAYYGPIDLIINAIDDNLYDFERSLSANDTRSPGELDNVIDHVDGGTGIFGSFAPDTLRIFVHPPR